MPWYLVAMFLCGVRVEMAWAYAPPVSARLVLWPPLGYRSHPAGGPSMWTLQAEEAAVPPPTRRLVRALAAHQRRFPWSGAGLGAPPPAAGLYLTGSAPRLANGAVEPVLLPGGLCMDLCFIVYLTLPAAVHACALPLQLQVRETRTVRIGRRLRHYPGAVWTAVPPHRVVITDLRWAHPGLALHGRVVGDAHLPLGSQRPLMEAELHAEVRTPMATLAAAHLADAFQPDPPPPGEASFEWLRQRPHAFRMLEIKAREQEEANANWQRLLAEAALEGRARRTKEGRRGG